jgi:hypothetical protein
MLGGVLDGVWASIAAEFGDDAHEIEEARLHLATVIIELACDHQLSAGQIARTAERLMREEKARAISDR